MNVSTRSRVRPIDFLIMGWRALSSPVVFGVNAIVENQDGKVVLVRHTYRGGWHLPGGGVERGEAPEEAILRELQEEIGLQDSSTPDLLRLYTRRVGWYSHLVALYRVRNATMVFKPNFEIHEISLCDPALPPADMAPGSGRRLAEYSGKALVSPYW